MSFLEPTVLTRGRDPDIPISLTDSDWMDGELDETFLAQVLTQAYLELGLDIEAPIFERSQSQLLHYYGTGGDVVIPDTITTIGRFSFQDCDRITSVFIPASVTAIQPCAFRGCSRLIRFEVDPDNPAFWSDGPCLYRKNSANSLISAPAVGDTWSIPPICREIAPFAFLGNRNLTRIRIPKSVTSLGTSAFEDCSSLQKVILPPELRAIPQECFLQCVSLTDITFPLSIDSIGPYAFQGCTGLTDVTLPDTITSLGAGAFRDCSSLRAFRFPSRVRWLPPDFLPSNSELSPLLPKRAPAPALAAPPVPPVPPASRAGQTRRYHDWTFREDADFLACITSFRGEGPDVTVPAILSNSNVQTIGTGAFSPTASHISAPLQRRRRSVTTVHVSEGIQAIQDHAFLDCVQLTEISLPDSLISIGEQAFLHCRYLTIVASPGSYAARYAAEHRFPFRSSCQQTAAVGTPFQDLL